MCLIEEPKTYKMDIGKILYADILDIIFDGKNKDYGAYPLRKNYNKRLAIALVSMGAILLLLFIGSVLANVLGKSKPKQMAVAQDIQLEKIVEPKRQEVIPPPVVTVTQPPRVEMVKLVPPRIVPDDQVKEDEKPPEVTIIDNAKIGNINQTGAKDDGIVAPPVEGNGPGPVTAPKVVEEDYTKVFTKVEKPATFKDGLEGWKRYLERNLQYPTEAQEQDRQGVINVQLVVDKDGNVSEVKALNPEVGADLAAEAERVIRKGPKWIPAEQNGRNVTYRFVQKITFVTNN